VIVKLEFYVLVDFGDAPGELIGVLAHQEMNVVPVIDEAASQIGADEASGACDQNDFPVLRINHLEPLSCRQVEAFDDSVGDALRGNTKSIPEKLF